MAKKKQEGLNEVALKMVEQGFSVEQVAEITGLDLKHLQQIIKNPLEV